ncbi:hypothetical protein Athai_59940 [Actinocatenispora thailandica]|uniref:Uncharacterized protein n=1 Tax=Actinocatenispora thailandica TaxID=227318 RepID=A0A7R7DVC7_9ACTN|nr:hypothetical protein [Actinocatenispora thailandica]BCJ38491.1 hypothetical protein Athai_59940 [Actinocatenispora thailandica]
MHTFLVLFPILVVLLALLALLVSGLVVYGRMLVRNQRRVLESLRRNGLAFLCRPTMGMRSMAGFILGIDRNAVSLWKVGLGQPKRTQTIPSHGARVVPATVRINVARSSPGLSVLSAGGSRVDVAVYPDPTMGYSAPTKGPSLDLVGQQIQQALTHPVEPANGGTRSAGDV